MAGPDPYVPERGNDGYDVTGYELDLEYHVTSNFLRGRARVTGEATVPLQTLRLDLVGMRVEKVTVDGRPARWSHRGGKISVTPTPTIDDGAAFAVDIRYSGNPRPAPSTWGPVGWEELADGVLVAGQPSGAATWFPCNDLPGQKAPFRIGVTAASSYHVVSNGRLDSGRVRGSRTTWVYEQPEPMAPYLATLHIGRYEDIDVAASPIAIRATLPPALIEPFETAFARQAEMVEVFSERFGPYPFEAGYRVVVTADPLEIPLEAQGMAVFGANHLDGTHERLIAHELAHQWFGNCVTASTWRDIWLHEGFACYAEWLWSEGSGGPPAAQHAADHHARLATLPQDLLIGDPGAADMFDDRVYKRGALTLHALRGHLGDEGFFQLLRRWVKEHQHGAVTTADFAALAGSLAGTPVDDLFRTWLYEPSLPSLTTAID